MPSNHPQIRHQLHGHDGQRSSRHGSGASAPFSASIPGLILTKHPLSCMLFVRIKKRLRLANRACPATVVENVPRGKTKGNPNDY
jgi:hypothetical protein